MKATGLLLAYLPGICTRTRPDEAQIWPLASLNRAHQNPWEQISRVAAHRNEDARVL